MRSYNIIRELTRNGHKVTVATLWTDDDERNDVSELSKFVHRIYAVKMPKWKSLINCIKALPTRVPLQAVYSWQPTLLRQLTDANGNHNLQDEFDVIHVEHLRGSKYGLQLKQKYPGIPIVWDSVDCISLLFKLASTQGKRQGSKWITSFELGRNQQHEGWLVRQFDHTLITSPIDRQALLDLVDPIHAPPDISIIPVGVDMNYFTPVGFQGREKNRLVISGKMSYHANVTMVLNFVENIYPRIRSERPDVKLWIAGKDPTNEIKALKSTPGIEVTGTVKDLRPYLQHATVALSPITYGAGMQIKVLEAMACETPVVSTSQAVSALQASHGQDVLVADDPAEFAKHVLRLLSDPEYQNTIGQAGHRYVTKHHKWSSIIAKLEGVYEETINKKSKLTNP
jgi:glycosyltransferase involved in cell wall biosynthesis